jgi:hypothetical protein
MVTTPCIITPSNLSEAEQAALMRLTCSGIEAEIAVRLAARQPRQPSKVAVVATS